MNMPVGTQSARQPSEMTTSEARHGKPYAKTQRGGPFKTHQLSAKCAISRLMNDISHAPKLCDIFLIFWTHLNTN